MLRSVRLAMEVNIILVALCIDGSAHARSIGSNPGVMALVRVLLVAKMVYFA